MTKEFNIIELKSFLPKSTWNGHEYFRSIRAGCYQVDMATYQGIMNHPTLYRDYVRKMALQQGESTVDVDPVRYYTIFKSISRYHMEFDSGVVIVRNVE